MTGSTFGERALEFYQSLKTPRRLPKGIGVMNPYRDPLVWGYVTEFCRRYYADNVSRTLVLGINPGRFGGGVTGVMFTDPVALESICGIRNDLVKRRETAGRNASTANSFSRRSRRWASSVMGSTTTTTTTRGCWRDCVRSSCAP
jgi:hypothetical protein